MVLMHKPNFGSKIVLVEIAISDHYAFFKGSYGIIRIAAYKISKLWIHIHKCTN